MKSTGEGMKETAKALQQLLGAFPVQDHDGSEREMVWAYILAVEGIPPSFVSLACKRFLQGLIARTHIHLRPTPPELAIEARRLLERALDRERLGLLPPRPPRRSLPEPSGGEISREMWGNLQDLVRRAAEAAAIPRQARRFKAAHAPAEDRPKVDISDFPAATATRAEQREWEARQVQRHAQEGSHGRDGEGPGASDLATAQTQESAPLAGA